MRPERGLRDAGNAEAARGQHEVIHPRAAIEHAIHAERLVGGDDHRVRRAEQAVVLHRLPRRGLAVAARDAHARVELKAALAPAREIFTAVFPRERKIGFRLAPGGVVEQRVAEAIGPRAAGDHHLPRLRVAPRGRALRDFQHPRYRGRIHLARQECAAAVAFLQQAFERAGWRGGCFCTHVRSFAVCSATGWKCPSLLGLRAMPVVPRRLSLVNRVLKMRRAPIWRYPNAERRPRCCTNGSKSLSL